MPIIKSAKKRAKQTVVRTERRRPFKTKMLTMVKNMLAWAKEGNVEKLLAHSSETQSAIDTAAKKNILPKNTAARKKSQVQKAVTAAQTEKKNTATPAPRLKTKAKAAPKAAAKAPAAKKATTAAKKPAAKKAPAKKA